MSFITAKLYFPIAASSQSFAEVGHQLPEVFYSESSNEKETDRGTCHIARNSG
jgi:hypothetical protein